MGLEYIQLFADMEALFEPFDDAQRGRLMTAMMAYAYRGEEPQFDGVEKFGWPALKQHIDRCAANVEAKKAAGSKGGKRKAEEKQGEADASSGKQSEAEASRAKQTQADASKAKQNAHNHDHDNDHEQEQDHKQEKVTARKARFTPPTIEEVEEYCRDRGNGVDAQRFVDFYASKGWKVGNNPMKDWKAAVRTWEGRDSVQTVQPIRPYQPRSSPDTTNPFAQMLREGYGT